VRKSPKLYVFFANFRSASRIFTRMSCVRIDNELPEDQARCRAWWLERGGQNKKAGGGSHIKIKKRPHRFTVVEQNQLQKKAVTTRTPNTGDSIEAGWELENALHEGYLLGAMVYGG